MSEWVLTGNIKGPPGESQSYYSEIWTWTIKLTDANTNGQVGLDAATWAAATKLNLSEKSANNRDMSLALSQLFKPSNQVLVQQKTDASRFGRYVIADTPIDNGTWWRFPLTFQEGSGAVPNGNAETVVTVFVTDTGKVVIPLTTDLLAGDGLGGVADSAIAPANVVQKQSALPTPTTLNEVIACLQSAGLCS